MRELLFLNPTLNAGLNLTVRTGTKWLDAQPGDLLDLVSTSTGESFGRALVAEAIMALNIDHLKPGMLAFERDPDCHTIGGLRKALDEAYPEGWGPTVTLLYYVVAPRP